MAIESRSELEMAKHDSLYGMLLDMNNVIIVQLISPRTGESIKEEQITMFRLMWALRSIVNYINDKENQKGVPVARFKAMERDYKIFKYVCLLIITIFYIDKQ